MTRPLKYLSLLPEIIRLYQEEYMSTKVIGRIFNLHHSTIAKALKSAGIPIRRHISLPIHSEEEFEAKLIEDIKQASVTLRRRPSPNEVCEWARDKLYRKYHRPHFPTMGTTEGYRANINWARRMIRRATRGMTFSKNGHSEFSVYGEPANQIPSFVVHKINGMQKLPKEIE